MLHVGLDLSRKQVEVCLISDHGQLIDRFTATPDRDGLYGLAPGGGVRRACPRRAGRAVGAVLISLSPHHAARDNQLPARFTLPCQAP